MVLLNTAPKVYGGSTAAVKVYAGSALAWTSVKVPAQLVLPGVASNYMQLPDSPALNITGDIEIVVRVAPTTWRPAETKQFVCKYNATGTQRQWRFYYGATGQLAFVFAPDGVNVTSSIASGTAIPADTAPRWLRFTRVAASGQCNFYANPDGATEPTTWTQLGAVNIAGTAGNLWPSTAPVTIGTILPSTAGTAGPLAARIYRVIVRNGIAGPVVLDVNEDDANASITSGFTATTGGAVTAFATAGNTIIQVR